MNKKLGIVLCTYNRPEYLHETIQSIQRADIPRDTVFIIVDDHSDNEDTHKIIGGFVYWCMNDSRNLKTEFVKKDKRVNISDSIQIGFNLAFTGGCDVAMNLDSDALVRNDFIERILEIQDVFKDSITTGFHCTTKNANGTERHKIEMWDHVVGFCTKKSVGGINMCFNSEVWYKYVRPVVIECSTKGGNWDHKVCIAMEKDGINIKCVVPSVIQHIGFDSAMNHTEQPDTADTFKPLRLKGVQLVCVDCVNQNAALEAMRKSMEHIQFDSATFFSDNLKGHEDGINYVQIPKIKSKAEYSDFMIRRLYDYITSPHILVVQYDGYVMNYKAWDPAWLHTDYIGATWWYNDDMNVGNGGFSLRSKNLHHVLKHDRRIVETHPEDDIICRKYRKHLEEYGLTWATEAQAKRFSIEGHKQKDRLYTDQFGYHGSVVQFHEDVRSKDVIIMNQFFGLGDILFLVAAARSYIAKGHKVIWPVQSSYVGINKHFPDITFVDKDLLKIDYDKQDGQQGNGFTVVPIRFTHRMKNMPFKDCMKSKYEFLDMDLEDWRGLTWERDHKAEDILFKKLGLKEGDKYCLVNQYFRNTNDGNAKINHGSKLKVVNMSTVEGFTLLDWHKVIENATEIHTVSTSIIYMLECMEVKAKDAIHIYKRVPDEVNHNNYDYLLKKNHYIYH